MTDEWIGALRESLESTTTRTEHDGLRVCDDGLVVLGERVPAKFARIPVSEVREVLQALDALTAARRERDEAEQRGRAAERADVVAHLRKSAADCRELGLFDSEQAVSDEADDIEAGAHVGAGKGET